MQNMFQKLRKENGLTQQELAKALGIHQTAVSQWECGHTLPDRSTIAKLADFYQVSADLLMGTPLAARQTAVFLGTVHAGPPSGRGTRPRRGAEENIQLSPSFAGRGEHFAMRVQGDSMNPRIFDGDTVIVRRQTELRHGDIAVMRIQGEEATIKQFLKRGSQRLLMPLNPDYEPICLTQEQLRSLPVVILGKVVELRAKL
ncbi:MAG: LexA family transcriptional regulator [Oscillospiraceae bacterium]|nr:LexA family transcriptional regulator [Oscillospiraceae bacterium]